MGCNPTMNYFSVPGRAGNEAVEAALNTLNITHLRNRFVNSLSGGERQLVYIARTLAQKPTGLRNRKRRGSYASYATAYANGNTMGVQLRRVMWR